MNASQLYAILFVAATAVACSSGGSGGGGGGAPPVGPTPSPAPPSQPIEHVVILIQENRTVDNLFNGFRGADTVKTGYLHTGTPYPLQPHSLAEKLTPNNSRQQFLQDLNGGTMNGFDVPPVEGQPGTYVYQYVVPGDVQPYWDIAKQYVLADRLFQTQGSGSFTAHQDLIAGGTQIDATRAIIDFPTQMPWGCDAPRNTVTSLITAGDQVLPNGGPFPCLTYPTGTLRDLLDAKNLTWKYYTPQIGQSFAGNIWNAFDAIRAVRKGPEWNTNIAIPASLLTDISSGKLPSVAWVCPEFANSDHPGGSPPSDTGPSWVAQVVNAIGGSQYWNSTAIVVLWDDWGGFYDHVPPPSGGSFGGFGFRVPMLVVSPYAKKGYVSHTQYEFGSILKFIEDNWKLGRLGTTDVRANSIQDVFDFGQPPRPFSVIPAKYSRSFFLRQAPSNRPLDNG
jgi:phospholipase C